MNNYTNYTLWKKWDSDIFAKLSEYDEVYFDKEIFGIKPDISSVLEIGFGNGNFYAWCKKNNIDFVGTETQEVLLKRAQEVGMLSYKTVSEVKGKFDLIAAFDVFEHIQSEDLLIMFKDLKKLLKKDGVIVARFPNGDSFLSMECQNGDYTHINWIGSNKIIGLADLSGFSLISYKPIFIPIKNKNILMTFKNLISNILRSLIENLVSFFMYKRFGRTTSANVVCVLVPKD